MLKSLQSIFKIPELKRRILFTVGMLVIYRIGGHIPTPGVDVAILEKYFANQAQNTLFALYDLFAGGTSRRRRFSHWASCPTSAPRLSSSSSAP